MSIWGNIRNRVRRFLLDLMQTGNTEYLDRSNKIAERREYRLGSQRRFLTPSREGYDDNVVSNFVRLALDRSISLLVGKEVKFEFESDEAQTFIDDIWEANNKAILLHKLALFGGEDGTVFVKIVPDQEKGFRLVAQDPLFKDVLTDPDDFEKVVEYITEYKTVEGGEEVSKKETVTSGAYTTVQDPEGNDHIVAGDPTQTPPNWLIGNYINNRASGGKWMLVDQTIWDYPMPPIVHWQNLVSVDDIWGEPDIPDDVLELQDRFNFNTSNIGRIVRFFAHPQRWSRMFSAKTAMDEGPLSMPNSNNQQAEIFQLPPVGDLTGASGHAQSLRQAIFDITRNTDISSMKDKVGALTNFGLRILFFDALNKLDTKRELYGWGLREINRRLQMFAGKEPEDCKVVWSDPLPVDETAQRTNFETDLRMGVVSKETVSTRLGYDWETEKQKLADQQQQDNQNNDNIGGFILRNFNRGGNALGGAQIGRQGQPQNMAR